MLAALRRQQDAEPLETVRRLMELDRTRTAAAVSASSAEAPPSTLSRVELPAWINSETQMHYEVQD